LNNAISSALVLIQADEINPYVIETDADASIIISFGRAWKVAGAFNEKRA
jgi:hypothetical protein